MLDLNQNIPLLLSLVFIVGGLAALAWSADRFIDSAAVIARAFGVSPFVVGMVVIGFGTSAPELAVSVLSGVSGHSNLSLGNAYGSCIFNIAGILGVVALIRPLRVKPSVAYGAVSVLVAVAALSWFLTQDMRFSRTDAFVLLGLFAALMPLYCWFEGKAGGADAVRPESGGAAGVVATGADWFWLFAGLALLIASSHLLVWGCVDFARDVLHVSDLLVGLTVVAIGTSLPELASAVVSARKGESEFVVGNIIGSNLFNMLGVVGMAGAICPFRDYSPWIVRRDLPVLALLSFSILLFGVDWRRGRKLESGRFNRLEGAVWILAFVGYTILMLVQEAGARP
ncbi:MAG: sodium:calcium antiporter [Kiritimatiellia bacterium]